MAQAVAARAAQSAWVRWGHDGGGEGEAKRIVVRMPASTGAEGGMGTRMGWGRPQSMYAYSRVSSEGVLFLLFFGVVDEGGEVQREEGDEGVGGARHEGFAGWCALVAAWGHAREGDGPGGIHCVGLWWVW